MYAIHPKIFHGWKGAHNQKGLARKDLALLVQWGALLVLDLLLHVIDRVARLDVERDGLAGEGLDENLRGAVVAFWSLCGLILWARGAR